MSGGPILKVERELIRRAAHAAVAKAIKTGELVHPRGLPCTDCDGEAIEYDHRDYTQPLKVQPVCRRCNLRRGAALVWTADGRRPIDSRVTRHLPADVLASVLLLMAAQRTPEPAHQD